MTQDDVVDAIVKLQPQNGDILAIHIEPDKVPTIIELIAAIGSQLFTGVQVPVIFLQPHESIELISDEEFDRLHAFVMKRRSGGP